MVWQSKRRAAVEERLAAKLREENEALELKTGKERARRSLRMDILRREDERSSFIAVVSEEGARLATINGANHLRSTKSDGTTSSSWPTSCVQSTSHQRVLPTWAQ